MQTKEEPTREIEDWGKVIFVSLTSLICFPRNNWRPPWATKQHPT